MAEALAPPVDDDDGVQTTDLLREKDRIREASSVRERRRRAVDAARARKAAERPEPTPAAPEAAPEEKEGGSALRHISPVEAIGGAVETITDLIELAEDAGAGVASLFGATPDQIEEAKNFGGSSNPLTQVIEQVEIGDPDGGSLIREVANFAVPFGKAGKINKLRKLRESGRAGMLASGAIQGAIADFIVSDEEDGRFVDMAEGTMFDNPLFDALQTQEGEEGLTRRFKTALEGAGIVGPAADATFGMLRLAGRGVRNLRNLRSSADVVEEATKNVEIQRADFESVMGQPEAPLVQVREAAESGGEPGGVAINFSRINSSDDVKSAMRELADSFSDSIGDAQRGVRTHEQTTLAAGEVDAFEVLMRDSGKNGATLNAEETLALRELWVHSSRKMQELTDVVAAESATPAQQIAFRRQLAVHQTIQERVLAVRTETARALNQWRIPAGDTLQFAADYEQMMAAVGTDARGVTKLAKRMQQAARDGDIKVLDDLVYGSRWQKVMDASGQLYYFSLLSGPHTHMRNMLSNSLMLGLNLSERKLANLMGRSFGDAQVVDGETLAMVDGLWAGGKDAFRITSLGREYLEKAKVARKAGRPDQVREIFEEAGDEVGTFHKARISGESGFGTNKIESSPISAFSPEKLGIESGRSPFGNAAFHIARAVDAVTTMPGRALSAADEVAKTVNSRMELHAQAHRQVMGEVAEGRTAAEAAQDRMHDILANPDESIQILARESAERNTFTNQPLDSASWRALQSVRRIPVVGTFLVPFVRTPYNLATQAFQRTPLAPLSKSWCDDFFAGGARTDLAITRMATGTAAMVSFADLTLKGTITGGGPPDPKERANLMRQGWQPYSVRVGDRYFSYRGLEPISTLISVAADTTEIVGHIDFDDMDEEKENLVLATMFAVMATVQNKTYLQGPANFFAMASDPVRYGETWAERSVGFVVPTAVAQVNRNAIDNVAREVNGMQEAIMARIPGLSDNLPPRRDAYGRQIEFGSGLGGIYDFISPVYSRSLDPTPADAEMQRLELWISKPKRKTTIDGEKVNLNQFPAAYDDLVRLAGNEMTHDVHGAPVDLSGLGFLDAVNALVTGQHPLSAVYALEGDGPEGGKAEMILDMQRRFQRAAKEQVLRDHPDLRSTVETKQRDKQDRELEALRQFGS